MCLHCAVFSKCTDKRNEVFTPRNYLGGERKYEFLKLFLIAANQSNNLFA